MVFVVVYNGEIVKMKLNDILYYLLFVNWKGEMNIKVFIGVCFE